ncbi:MAG: hypothetical protein Q8L29_00540 [archaeon]|nr:hypothetical protein [archaeon]
MDKFKGLIKILTDKKNLKYASADIGGFICGISAATLATIGLKEAEVSDELNVAFTLGAKMTGFAIGNITTYFFIHNSEYDKGEKNWKKDLNSLAKSNFHGAWIAGILKVGGHYTLLKLTDIPYYIVPAIVYPAAGFVGTVCRHWKNYKSGLIGNGKIE